MDTQRQFQRWSSTPWKSEQRRGPGSGSVKFTRGFTMTISITNRPAPAWLRELAHGRDIYEELLGWPVSVQVGKRVLIVAIGQALDAVSMPAGLGALVRAELGIALLSGPTTSWRPEPRGPDFGQALFRNRKLPKTGTLSPGTATPAGASTFQLQDP